MKSRCNVALSGAFVIFLLFLSDVGGDALKDESGEDDLKTPLPLVVSIPSKVFRANRLNANDVIGVMPTLDTEKVEFTHFVTTRRPISTTSEESTIASSTSTTTTTPSPTTELTTPSTTTTTTELTTTTTERETIVANISKEIEANHTDSDSIDSRNESIQLENNSTSAENHTSTFEVTERATTTTELTTPSTTTTTTTTTTSTTTARSSANEEVAEKDYGQALGFDLEPELDEHPTFSSDSQDGDGMSVVAAVTSESEIEETTSDEIDPFDVAAQASEVDYAVIASEDQRGFTQTKQEMRRNETVLYENEEEEESLEEREEGEESSNGTLSNNVNFAEKHNETDEFENDDNNNNKQSFASTNALYNLNKKFLSKDDPQKDLLPAASSRGSPTVVGPEAQMDDLSGHSYDDIVPTAEASSAIKQEAAPTAAADPEYEYIYEYVDLNTTDIPTDLPEGVVILTGDQRLPIASTVKPVIEVSTESRLLTTIDDHHPILEAKSNATIAEEQPLPHDYEEFHSLDGNTKPSDDLKAYTGDDLKAFTSDDMKSFTGDDLKSFTNGDFVTEPATAAADPFVPNFPQSPVYFVGLQRETLPPSDESSAPDSFISAHSTTTEQPKSLRGEAAPQSDPNVQINTLYALSRALPINDNVPFLIEDGELENTTILLPPDLPDPFSDELLGTSVGIPQSTTEEFFATATTELPSTSTEPATTPTPTTTTEEPTTTTTEATTTTTTEEPTTSATRATRPGSRRRTTTSAAPEGSSVEQATTAATGTRQRGQRVGGRRRPTTSTAAPSNGANGGSTNFTLTEKTRTGQRNRRPVLSRSRTTTAGSNIEEASNDSTGDKNGATNDNSISGTNGVKRAGSSRRTLSRPSSNGNGSENGEAGSTIPQRPTRARRPVISRSGSKLNKEASKASSSSNETSSEKKGEEAATRKPLFRPRNRSRFNLRNKAEAASSTTTTTTTEHHSPSEEVALTTAEHAEGGGEHTGEEASDAPAENAANGNGEKAIVTEAPAPSGEHSRKFPPRTRPGARATIRHSQS